MPNYTEENVELIKTWLEEEPNLPSKFDEDMIKRFLHCSNNNIERTKKVMQLFFNCRLNFKEFFHNTDVDSEDVQRILKVIDALPLPNRTKEGYQLYIAKLRDKNPDNFNLSHYGKMFFMMHDVRMRTEDIPDGDIPILDMDGFGFKHLTKLVFSFGVLKKYMLYNQEAHPVKLTQVHVINTHGLLDKVFTLIKPLLKPAVKEMIHFHSAGSNTIEEFIPRELLPEEYGGTSYNLDDLKDIWVKRMKEHANWLKEDNRWKEIPTNEIKRDKGSDISSIEFD